MDAMIQQFLSEVGRAEPTLGQQKKVSAVSLRLREARKKQGWSQARLGAIAGVSSSSVARAEYGRIPSRAILARLADALEVDAAWLAGEEECART